MRYIENYPECPRCIVSVSGMSVSEADRYLMYLALPLRDSVSLDDITSVVVTLSRNNYAIKNMSWVELLAAKAELDADPVFWK